MPKFSLFPNYIFNSLTEITPDFLISQKISFLMIDLDNTIAGYDEAEPSEAVLQWFDGIRQAGVSLFLISNSTRTERVSTFAGALNLSYVMNARKPSPNGLRRAMGMANTDIAVSAFVGDQIFTDTLAANLAGIKSILVQPVRFTNFLLYLRYIAERPFRRVKKRGAHE